MKLRKSENIKECSGVTFYPNVEIETIEGKNKNYFIYIGEILIIFLSAIFVLGCFVTGVKVGKVTAGLIFAIAILTLVEYLQFYFKKQLKYTLFGSVLFYFFAVYLYMDEIREGFCLVANKYIGLLNNYYDLETLKFVTGNHNKSLCITVFYIFILTISITMVSAAISYRWDRLIYILATFPLAFASVIVGILPNAYFFSGYIILLVTVCGGQISTHSFKKNPVKVKASLILLAISTILFLVGSRLFTPHVYNNKIQVQDAKKNIQLKLNNISRSDYFSGTFLQDLLSSSKATGGLSNGKLGKVDEVRFSNETALKITLPDKKEQGAIYLRGYIGSKYENNKWNMLGKEDINKYNQINGHFNDNGINVEICNDLYLKSKGTASVPMVIENVNAGDNILFAPYKTKEVISLTPKGYIILNGVRYGKFYKLSYYPKLHNLYNNFIRNSTAIVGNRSREFEKLMGEYREYVYDVYTRLSEKETETERMFKDVKIDKTSQTDVIDKIDMVKKYLKENATYSLYPGKIPKGEDFVDYFMFKSKKGYCTYFASAAVVIFRSMGIPARYVEGYIINNKDMRHAAKSPDNKNNLCIDIKDTNAHAWAEVYFDGFGWYPVETTPGYTQESQPKEITSKVEKDVNKQVSSEENKQTMTPSPTEVSSGQVQNIPGEIKVEEHGKRPGAFIKFFILILFFIGIGCGVLIGRRKIKFKIQEEVLQNNNFNDMVVLLYKELSAILKHYGFIYENQEQEEYAGTIENKFSSLGKGAFQEVLAIALKAGFSKSEISEEEIKKVVSSYSLIQEEAYTGSTWIEKLYFKYILAVWEMH